MTNKGLAIVIAFLYTFYFACGYVRSTTSRDSLEGTTQDSSHIFDTYVTDRIAQNKRIGSLLERVYVLEKQVEYLAWERRHLVMRDHVTGTVFAMDLKVEVGTSKELGFFVTANPHHGRAKQIPRGPAWPWGRGYLK